MKIKLRCRHFVNAIYTGAVSGAPSGIKMVGCPIQRALLEKFTGANVIRVEADFCQIDATFYNMFSYTYAMFIEDLREYTYQMLTSEKTDFVIREIEMI